MRIDPTAAQVARRIYKRGQQKKVHLLGTRRSAGLMQLESRLEASVAIALSLDPRVHEFRPQPAVPLPGHAGPLPAKAMRGDPSRTTSPDASRNPSRRAGAAGLDPRRRYTPDFAVRLVTGEEILLEAKHSRLLARHPEVATLPARFAAIGRRLVIVTEADLPETLDQNLRLLAPCAEADLEAGICDALAAALAAGPLRCAALLARTGLGRGAVLAALARGRLQADLRAARLGPDTVLAAGRRLSPDHAPCLEILPL